MISFFTYFKNARHQSLVFFLLGIMLLSYQQAFVFPVLAQESSLVEENFFGLVKEDNLDPNEILANTLPELEMLMKSLLVDGKVEFDEQSLENFLGLIEEEVDLLLNLSIEEINTEIAQGSLTSRLDNLLTIESLIRRSKIPFRTALQQKVSRIFTSLRKIDRVPQYRTLRKELRSLYRTSSKRVTRRIAPLTRNLKQLLEADAGSALQIVSQQAQVIDEYLEDDRKEDQKKFLKNNPDFLSLPQSVNRNNLIRRFEGAESEKERAFKGVDFEENKRLTDILEERKSDLRGEQVDVLTLRNQLIRSQPKDKIDEEVRAKKDESFARSLAAEEARKEKLNSFSVDESNRLRQLERDLYVRSFFDREDAYRGKSRPLENQVESPASFNQLINQEELSASEKILSPSRNLVNANRTSDLQSTSQQRDFSFLDPLAQVNNGNSFTELNRESLRTRFIRDHFSPIRDEMPDTSTFIKQENSRVVTGEENLKSSSDFTPANTNAPQLLTKTIKIRHLTFDFPQLTIKQGQAVQWLNNDGVTHRIKAEWLEGGKSSLLITRQSFTYTFTEPGVYHYTLDFYPDKKATITVEALQQIIDPTIVKTVKAPIRKIVFPRQITIFKGDTVIWINNDSVKNSIAADWIPNRKSPDLITGATFSFTFNQAGTYRYRSGVFSASEGEVIVKERP